MRVFLDLSVPRRRLPAPIEALTARADSTTSIYTGEPNQMAADIFRLCCMNPHFRHPTENIKRFLKRLGISNDDMLITDSASAAEAALEMRRIPHVLLLPRLEIVT